MTLTTVWEQFQKRSANLETKYYCTYGYGIQAPTEFVFTCPSELWSRDNPGWRHRLGHGNVGGPFMDSKYDIDVTSPYVDILYRGYTVRGTLFAKYQAASAAAASQRARWPAMPSAIDPLIESNMIAKGSAAINKTAPTKPAAEAAVAVAELLREGIPKRPGSQLKEDVKKYRALGSEYLNVEFGWKPFVSELRTLSKAIMESEMQIERLKRTHGQHIRRQFDYPDSVSDDPVIYEPDRNPVPGLVTGVYHRAGKATRQDSKTTRQWFSGAFIHYSTLEGTSSYERVKAAAARARHLYGIAVTPEVLWNLMPWSWAADWFVSIGDVMSNLSLLSNDGLVMQYGYMMREDRASRKYTLEGAAIRNGPTASDYSVVELGVLTQTLSVVQKRRITASPFGFGITWDGASTRQIAIATALGLSRS